MAVRSSSKSDFWAFLRGVVDVEPRTLTDDDSPWPEPAKRYEVEEDAYCHRLEMLPAPWIHGDWVAFGEGTGPFCIYVKLRNSYFVRELTDGETRTLSKLSGTPLHI